MNKKAKPTVDVTTAALRLINGPGMTLETLYIMLQAERQHRFPDEITEMYIDALQTAITLMEQPMFD